MMLSSVEVLYIVWTLLQSMMRWSVEEKLSIHPPHLSVLLMLLLL
jgi:hypothetical protein